MRLIRKAGFICTALFITVGSQAEPTATTSKTFRWMYNQRGYSLNYDFQNSTYAFYKDIPRTYSDYADYVIESSSYPFISRFATALKELGTKEDLNEWETVNMIVKFVQSIPYRTEVGEYPRFPIETLVDFKGDCEDFAILLASILSYLGYDVILVSPPAHMAVAVACTNCEGTYYEYDGKRFFYVETTDVSWPIGTIPKQYQGKEAKIYAVSNVTDSGTMMARSEDSPSKLEASDPDLTYNALITVDGVTYRVRLTHHADGSWSYE